MDPGFTFLRINFLVFSHLNSPFGDHYFANEYLSKNNFIISRFTAN